MYSVEQVAALLGLHVRTVRSYIRSGRLNAVRIGKQYRIAKSDLEQLTGRSTEPTGTAGAVEVSSIVQLDGVDRAAADRLGSLVLAGVGAPRVQTLYDEHRHRLKIIVIGELAETAEVMQLLDSVLNSETGLLTGE
ncbi:DNA binding domain-containing protein, excisionase family [Saccharopolyspora flava]|uniref:DNA binding domain-containing protein, excisionase family n=2 Tax=Saccharopolyspora flava TaxID=95161 RepID=A0A1I6QT86_9PSEU|nr:DNA binding domain-containing protein, excisionase family [Saccharopolyspora flava]